MASLGAVDLSDADAASPPASRERFGHPRGLGVLAGTELFERISFHGMQSLLTLYMAGWLLRPGRVEHIAGFAAFRRGLEALTGPLSATALASQIFGLSSAWSTSPRWRAAGWATGCWVGGRRWWRAAC